MKRIGILGGMGPLAGAHLVRRLAELCAVTTDNEHPPVCLNSRSDIPDRTAYLIGRGRSPLPAMQEGIAELVAWGADVILLGCNTAHCFLRELRAETAVPILNMPKLTVAAACRRGARRLGLLATSGTVGAGIYRELCRQMGAVCLAPSEQEQRQVDALIYCQKAGGGADPVAFLPILQSLLARGAETILLGCTEISFAFFGWRSLVLLDAVEVTARACLRVCGMAVREEESHAFSRVFVRC